MVYSLKVYSFTSVVRCLLSVVHLSPLSYFLTFCLSGSAGFGCK